ncbi:hypothetical protein HYQ46_009050 [Verticillium longisporum]|nr:hypothetical protein HYQ46_009050 [Verticillium longisporum]
MPRGNIFQGLSTIRKTLRKTVARKPSPSSRKFCTASSTCSSSFPLFASGTALALSSSSLSLSRWMSRYSTQLLPAQSRSRKVALTAVPTMLPTRARPSKRSRKAPLVAATTTQVMMTTVLWPREKKVPTETGRWPEAMRRRVIRSIAEM